MGDQLLQTKPLAGQITPLVQRQVNELEEEKEETFLQAKAGERQGAQFHPDLESRLCSLQGCGQPLPDSVRAFFEPRFGCNFGRVRVHTNGQAQALARTLQAQGFTHGRHIIYGSGKFNPETREGKQLLAHELTHVVQQSRPSPSAGVIQRTIGDDHDLTSPRFKGDPDLEAAYDDEKYLRRGDSGPAVAKLQQALVDAGYVLPVWGVDGIFGSETENAMERYQGDAGITIDGVVGPETMGALDSRFGPEAVPSYQNCTPMVTGRPNANERLEAARIRAIQYATDALRALQTPQAPGTIYDTALRRHFISPDSTQRGTLVQVYGNIMAWLGKRRKFVCGSRTDCGKSTAFHWGDIIAVCPRFWTKTPVCQSIILIHEAAHGSGVSVGWHAPRRGNPPYPLGNVEPRPPQTTPLRMYNPDAYAFFAHHVSVGADTSTNCRESP